MVELGWQIVEASDLTTISPFGNTSYYGSTRFANGIQHSWFQGEVRANAEFEFRFDMPMVAIRSVNAIGSDGGMHDVPQIAPKDYHVNLDEVTFWVAASTARTAVWIFIKMGIITYILCLPAYFAMKIIALALTPFTSLFCSKDGKLPRVFAWLETPDSDMFGCYGDKGFCARYANRHGTFWGRWWTCLCWQWRNTAQGFATYALGLDESKLYIIETVYPAEFECYKKTAWQGNTLVGWELKGSYRYGKTNRRLRWRIGWKFGWEAGQKAQYVFMVHPFMKV